VAVVIGVGFAFGTQRTRLGRLPVLEAFVLGPILVPGIAFAIAMYTLMAQLGLVGSATGLAITHVLLALPFVILIVGAAMSRVPSQYEEAAMSLGASRLRAHVDITIRLLSAAIFGAALFAFITSFDDAVYVSFLAGPGFTTLPLEIFHSLQFGVDPAVTAIAGTLTVATAAVVAMVTSVGRGGR
jgi:ABC-type spermidine/putrescine transport system permease subunit II